MNSNKISANLQGMIMQAQLYGRALDIITKLRKEEIEVEGGALKVAAALQKQDFPFVLADTFHRFLEFLMKKQGDFE